jgi:hypothetical protein
MAVPVEHEFLRRYLRLSWGAAPRRPGPAEQAESRIRFFVDAFAGSRPGVRAEEGGCAWQAAVREIDWLHADAPGAMLLLDDDPAEIERLAAGLRGSGAPLPPLETALPEALPDRSGCYLEARSWADMHGRIEDLVETAAGSLVWIDPPSAAAAPWASCSGIAGASRADVLLCVPAGDLRRLAQHRGMPLSDLPTHVRRSVEGVSAMLGDERHRWVRCWGEHLAQGGVDAAERFVAELVRERFACDAERIVRLVELVPAQPASATVRLVLSTTDPARALEVERILHRLRQAGVLEWSGLHEPDSVVRIEESGEIDLFRARARNLERRVDRAGVAALIRSGFAGRVVSLGELMRAMVGTGLFPEELRQSLSQLRRAGLARYRSLGDPQEEIEVLTEPAPRSRTKRMRRPELEPDLFAGPQE